jgi:hypothetical protein
MIDKRTPMTHHFDNKFDLLAVWLFSSLSFMTMNNLVGFFAILASLVSIVKALPSIIRDFKKLMK